MREPDEMAEAAEGAAVVSEPWLLFAEDWVIHAIHWLRLGIETIGACVIAVGLVVALRVLLTTHSQNGRMGFGEVRLTFARYLALALEFQLAADILSTAVNPDWNQLGKLAAVAVIRTGLNWFLMREMETEQSSRLPPTAEPRG